MKKLFTLIALITGSMAAMATDYTDKLVVTINGTSTAPADATITVDEQSDGKYALSLKNFELNAGEGQIMSVGTINLLDVEATANGNSTILRTNQTITIDNGDGVPSSGFWMGPMLGEVPVDLTAKIEDGQLYTIININMAMMGTIEVVFGDTYQIGNSGFELFHTATASTATSDEPNSWHSFMSCTGMLAGIVNTVPHTFISNETRPGSAGERSVLIKSGMVLGSILANGTLTTGRMKAGGFTAEDTNNNAFLDITSTDLDENGDPFYTLLNGKPDSLSVWVKFKQATPQEDYPYATITAVITDGSYYQEPVDKDYTDIIVARAANPTIESNDFAWQRLTIPFDYSAYTEKDAKAILVTISTNAGAGKGSDNDELYVDDLSLIYNSKLASLKFKGEEISGFDKDVTSYEIDVNGEVTADDFEAVSDGKGATVTTTVDYEAKTATITVMSNDLRATNVYSVVLNGLTDGISSAKHESVGGQTEIYDLNGQRANTMTRGKVYITKQADGKTVKTLKK